MYLLIWNAYKQIHLSILLYTLSNKEINNYCIITDATTWQCINSIVK